MGKMQGAEDEVSTFFSIEYKTFSPIGSLEEGAVVRKTMLGVSTTCLVKSRLPILTHHLYTALEFPALTLTCY